ncbi:MAG: hypothetical protein AAB453_04430 [Patescibacteria group bacterium]
MKHQKLITKIVVGLLLTIGIISFFIKPTPAVIVTHEPSAKELAFRDLKLEAKAVIIFDPINQEVIYENNADAQLPIASLTKIMTALIANETLVKEKPVEISTDSIREFGDYGFRVGERWQLKNLLDYTLVTSANDGARALASAFTPDNESVSEIMNQRAKKLNLNQTYFTNATGLDYFDKLPSAQSSARDLSKLFSYILTKQPELFEATTRETINTSSLDLNLYSGQNTNKLAGKIPGLLGSKTGFTDVASGNLVLAFDRGLNQPIVVVVLGSSADGRFSDMEELIHKTMRYFSL